MRKVLLILLTTAILALSVFVIYLIIQGKSFGLSETLTVLGLLVAIGFGVINLPKNKKIRHQELTTMIEKFLPTEKNGVSWLTETDETSSINWKTKGIDADGRRGTVLLNIKGKPSHYKLEDKRKHCPWTIQVAGPTAGISVTSLSSDYVYHPFEPDSLLSYLDKKFKLTKIDSFEEFLGSGVTDYRIEHKKYAQSHLRLEYSSSKAGSSVTIMFGDRNSFYEFPEKPTSEEWELTDLIKEFLMEEKWEHTVPAWDTGADESSPISWRTKGRDVEEPVFGPDLGMIRKGEVLLNMNGEPSHYILEEVKKQCPWDIEVTGPNADIFVTAISAGGSELLYWENIYKYLNKEFKLKRVKEFDSDNAISGCTDYKIQHKKYLGRDLRIYWGCGASQCGVTILIGISEFFGEPIL